ncbi:MAG: efflux RND transporter periplasmic adaptor subunit [Bacteroidetes bacterium]|nr:efflux RND transporter periplasmic adaptor subunit [Bacteroidota bacterium]
MKKNWKFDKGTARGNGIVAFSVFIGIAILFFISSCSSRDEHKHIQTNKTTEILTEQQNLIYLLNNSLNDLSLINSSKTKLQLLGLNNEQLEKIETTKQPINPLPIYSPYTGHIQDLGISSGSFCCIF